MKLFTTYAGHTAILPQSLFRRGLASDGFSVYAIWPDGQRKIARPNRKQRRAIAMILARAAREGKDWFHY